MLLPPCPLRLNASFFWRYLLGGLALGLIGLAAAVGLGIWQYEAITQLLDQTRVWRDGVPAVRTEVSGKETTNKVIFHTYALDVHYFDAGGAVHDAKLEFDTLATEVDQTVDPLVRYARDDPGRFALSWAMDVKTSRWVSIGFMLVAGFGLVSGCFLLLGYGALRRLTDARRCARRSDEILVRVTKATQQFVNGRHKMTEYLYSGQTLDGRPVAGKVLFPPNYEPLFADQAKQVMVALVPQENLKRSVVLRGDFYPFELNADEQAKVRAGIASRRPAGG